jgi:hypothetical protein
LPVGCGRREGARRLQQISTCAYGANFFSPPVENSGSW